MVPKVASEMKSCYGFGAKAVWAKGSDSWGPYLLLLSTQTPAYKCPEQERRGSRETH